MYADTNTKKNAETLAHVENKDLLFVGLNKRHEKYAVAMLCSCISGCVYFSYVCQLICICICCPTDTRG